MLHFPLLFTGVFVQILDSDSLQFWTQKEGEREKEGGREEKEESAPPSDTPDSQRCLLNLKGLRTLRLVEIRQNVFTSGY